jgi:predicted transcriptional regulator
VVDFWCKTYYNKHMSKKFTQIDIENIIRRKQDGESLRSIAKDYGTSGDSLSNVLNRRGITFKNPWTEDETQELISLRKEGVSYQQIADTLNKSYNSVKRKCSDLIKEGQVEYIGKNRGGITYDYPKEELLNIVKQYVSCEACPSHYRSNIKRVFGSWTKALEAAGIPGNIGGNFCSDRVTRVYLLRFETFYKIGVTQQQVKSRFSGAPEYEVLDILETDLDNAVYLEKELKKAIKPFQYVVEHPWFERNGKTECFVPDIEIRRLEDVFVIGA